MSSRSRRAIVVAAATTTLAAAGGATALAQAPASPGTSRGPSTTVNPYVRPVAPSVSTKSILTVGDKPAGNGFRMVGIPDGLGALESSGGAFELFMNHELRFDQGIARRHGQTGAFVSDFKIDSGSLAVRSGRDLIDPGVDFWNYVPQTYGDNPSTGGPNPRRTGDVFESQIAQFNRFCSSTLTDPGQLYNRRSGRGYDGQIYFGNEEAGNNSRSFGVTTDGTAQQLPRLGLFSWENTIPAPNESDRTLVMGNEDVNTGQLWAYVGSKSKKGNPFQRAGLTNGTNNVIDVDNPDVSTDAQFRLRYPKGTPAPVVLSQVEWDQSAAAQNSEAAADGLTLNRIEDGHFDPRHPNDYYFLTTEGGNGAVPSVRDGGGLWRLRYDDVDHPEDGGTLTLLLDGSEPPLLNKPDNMTIDTKGNLLIQEDPGNNPSVARVLAYRIKDGALATLAQFDPPQYQNRTQDEESSGIIDAKDFIGKGWFLLDAQIHVASDSPPPFAAEEVEEGQLLAMRVSDFGDVYGDDGDGDDDEKGRGRG